MRVGCMAPYSCMVGCMAFLLYGTTYSTRHKYYTTRMYQTYLTLRCGPGHEITGLRHSW